MRDVKLARFEPSVQVFGIALHIGKSQLAKIAGFDAVNNVAAEGSAKLVLALLADGVEFDGLASRSQLFGLLTR